MAGFCHPGSSDFGSYAQNANGLANVRAIAVISGPAFSKLETYADEGSRYAGPKAGTDRYQYVLQRGWKVGPEAHGDNHCFNFGSSTRNRTVLLATSLSKASAMDAMLNRRFYTSSDKNAQMFFGTADLTKVMGQTFTSASATLDLLAWISDPDGSAVSTVTLYTGNPAAGTGSPTSAAMTNAGGGSYTATVTVPASGSAYYYVYATLANGGELFSSPVWVSRGSCSDTTLPTASITAPAAGTVTGTVTVSASGSDNVGVTGMTLAIDGSTVATSTSGSVSYSWNTTGLAAGSSHTITATATDACGNVSATASRSVTIGGTSGDIALTSGVAVTGQSVAAERLEVLLHRRPLRRHEPDPGDDERHRRRGHLHAVGRQADLVLLRLPAVRLDRERVVLGDEPGRRHLVARRLRLRGGDLHRDGHLHPRRDDLLHLGQRGDGERDRDGRDEVRDVRREQQLHDHRPRRRDVHGDPDEERLHLQPGERVRHHHHRPTSPGRTSRRRAAAAPSPSSPTASRAGAGRSRTSPARRASGRSVPPGRTRAASPHGGTKLAAFNSYTAASGVQKRMYRATGFAVASSYTTVSLKFWMYHDTGYSTNADKVQAQVSTNGTTWTNVGTAISRYSATAGWTQATIDLSAYKGQTVYLAFVGISAYGNDIYLDDVTVTGQ